MSLNINIKKGNAIQLMNIMESESVDLLVTDPPYKIITGGNSNGKNSTRPKGMLSGNRSIMRTVPKFDEWLPECYRVLKEGSHAYIMVNNSNLVKMMNSIENSGFKIHNLLVWEKNNCTPSQFYMKNCEYIVFCRKGKAKYINNIGASKTVHSFKNIIGNKQHPTEKPIELMKFYIENSSNIGDIVFDPFMGSGSTGVASIMSERKFKGFELEEDYFDIAYERIYSLSN